MTSFGLRGGWMALVSCALIGCATQPKKTTKNPPKTVVVKPKPRLAVFTVVPVKVQLDSRSVDAITRQLAEELAGTKDYEVIGDGEIRKALDDYARKTKSPCLVSSCYREIAKLLGAAHYVSARLIRTGESRCTLAAALYSVTRAGATSGVRQDGLCSPEAIATAMPSTVGKLTGREPGGVSVPWNDSAGGGGQPRSITFDCPGCDFDERPEGRWDHYRMRRDAREDAYQKRMDDERWKRGSRMRKSHILQE